MTRVAQALAALLALATLAAGCAYASFVAFGTYAPYDDEGYFQAALALVRGGARLYDDVETPYGPAWLVARELAHGALRVPLSTDGARIALVPTWIAAALACAAAAAACARGTSARVPTALVAFACALVHVRALANEPGHPQDTALLLALVALVAAQWSGRGARDVDAGSSRRGSARALSAVAGVAWAGAVLTKVNVGVLSGLPLVAHAVRARGLRAGACLAGLALPWALMRARLGEPECIALALASNVAWATACGVIWSARGPARDEAMHPRARSFDLVLALVAALATAVVLVAWLVARGTSVQAFVSCVFVAPLRFTSQIERGLDVPLLGSASALVSLAAWSAARRAGTRIGVTAKLAFGVAAVVLGLADSGAAVAFALPWSWLALEGRADVRRERAEASLAVDVDTSAAEARDRARGLLALFAALFPLQAFPVTGTQLVLGALPLVVLGVVAVGDVARLATARARRLLAAAASCGALVAVVVGAHAARAASVERDALPLAGARLTRFDEFWGARQACLAATLAASDAAFVSVRGDHSLHAWTGRAPPSSVLVSHAFGVLSAAQHARLVDDLRRASRPLVLDQPGRWSAATRASVPLLAFVDAELAAGGRIRTDVLMHRRGDPPPQWSRCALLASPDALELELRVPGDVALARARRVQVFDAESGALLADSADRARGARIELASKRVVLAAPLARGRAAFGCLRLLDANGERFLTLPIVLARE